jgi:Uma2 family endonuclease
MKAVMWTVPPDLLAWRKKTGAEQWDEMWDGVLHMNPSPNRLHQDFEYALEAYLRAHWAPRAQGKVYHQINLARPGGWPKDYRIPDLVLLTPDRFGIDRNEYFEGPSLVVVEIRNPEDESYDKMPFYASLGVPEVWVIDRDTKEAELHVLASGAYAKVAAGRDGWLRSVATSVEMRRSETGRLAIRIAGDPASERIIPE